MRDALRFLTILPLGDARRRPGQATLAAFPAVGAFVGLVWVLVGRVGDLWLGPAVAAVLILVVDALLTGMLHLDALADVADGTASRLDADEAVEVMRDPTVGAAGATALVLICLLRFSMLIMASVATGRLLAGVVPVDALRLLAAPICGRAAMVALLARVPPRRDGSLAAAFTTPTRRTLTICGLLAVIGVSAAGVRGILALILSLLFTLWWAAWWRHRFGNLTGDGVGACGLLAETLALGIVVAS